MKYLTLGNTDLVVSRLAYGCMRISGAWNPADVTPAMREKGKEALLAAYETGYTLFDHADIYGKTVCEEIHGELLAERPDLRDQTIIATKCGIQFENSPNPGDPHRYDFRGSHIIESCEDSLRRLQVDTIDIYQLHRPDYLMNPEEIAVAFSQLHESGKVRYFGVSNFLPSKVRALQAWLPEKLVVNQVEISPKRLDCFEDGTLDQCFELGLTALAWSPLAGGNLEAFPILKEVGARIGATPSQVALAWLMTHPAHIVPIVGSTQPERISEMAESCEIELSREDWYRTFVACRGRGLD